MKILKKHCQLLELNRLEFPFMGLRQHDSLAYVKMVHSIDRETQLVPVITVPSGEQRWILIDGYLRVRALQKLAADTLLVRYGRVIQPLPCSCY
jgi:ParB-like chromosome segregation protein Spo0J